MRQNNNKYGTQRNSTHSIFKSAFEIVGNYSCRKYTHTRAFIHTLKLFKIKLNSMRKNQMPSDPVLLWLSLSLSLTILWLCSFYLYLYGILIIMRCILFHQMHVSRMCIEALSLHPSTQFNTFVSLPFSFPVYTFGVSIQLIKT